MDSLPPELISRVLDHICPQGHDMGSPPSLASYATLGHRWQAIIERRTFANIQIDTPKRMKEFQQIATDPRRRSCVKHIDLVVQLESYDVPARARWETDEERQQNNRIFTSTISTLFKILSSWPADATSIELSIWAMCPSDFLDFKQRRRQAARSRLDDLLHMRYERSYLEFSRTTPDIECPPVPIVTSLSIHGLGDERVIEPASSVFIASKLPGLNRVRLSMRDDCKRDEQLRQRLRNDFASNLHLLPAKVQEFDLQFQYEPPSDQYYTSPDVMEDGSDLLSSSLRNFSQRLERLCINQSTVVGPELFWPSNAREDTLDVNQPFWPNLKAVRVNYAPVTPSGEWLLERDPEKTETTDEDTDDEYYEDRNNEEESYPESVRIPLEARKLRVFRNKIIASHANKFYISAARAALRMPQLRQMVLQTDSSPLYVLEYEVRAATSTLTWSNYDPAIDFEIDTLTKEEKDRRLYQPDERVFAAWEKVANKHTGKGLETGFKKWEG